MFRILINQTKNYAKQQTREYARQRYRPNAGIRRQTNAETNDFEIESSNWDDDLSKYEGDLTNTSETYQQYRHETETERDRLRRNIVRNKYFNEKKLSFLTWGEMEQIRLLNAEDPEEWDDQKLAESFPADVATIRKVLKANWQPRDSKRVARYDEKVRSNWQSFVKGECKELDERFSEHLQKFSKRNLSANVNLDSVLKKEMPKPESTEFLGIITSCKKYKDEPKQISSKSDENVDLQAKQLGIECSTPNSINSNKLYTFKPTSPVENTPVNSRTTETIFNNPSGTGIKLQNNLNSQKSTLPVKNPNGTGMKHQNDSNSSTLTVTKFEGHEIQLRESDLKQLSVASIRRHIVIPDKLFKEGATYRLDDCYYDDDGEFLYRVPGMTKL